MYFILKSLNALMNVSMGCYIYTQAWRRSSCSPYLLSSTTYKLCQNWEYNYHVTYADFPSRLPTESTSVTGNKTIQTGSVEKEKRQTNGKAASVISLVCEPESVYRQTVLWSWDGVRLYWGRGAMSTRRHHVVNEQLTINSWLPIRLSSLNSRLIVATLAIQTVNLKLPNSLRWKL